jgi:glycosyltransferase involved in cell wall biosynthesis
MARGDVVIANSQFTADMIARLYPQARDRLRVIPRGTDLRKFSPASVEPTRVARLREVWGLAPHERVVLVAARLTAWKGQKILIEAAHLLQTQGLEDVRYVWPATRRAATATSRNRTP